MSPAERSDRIWFHPPIFWAATKDMPKAQADELLDKVITLAERQDFRALQEFDFISLEDVKKSA